MRSLILLIVLLFSTQTFAQPIPVYSGVFCNQLSGIKSLFVELNSTKPGYRILLSKYGCARIGRPAFAEVSPTFQTVISKGSTYYVYRFDFLDSNLVLYGYTSDPPKSDGIDI